MKMLLVLSAIAALTVACGGADTRPADPSTTSTTSDPKADPKAAAPAAAGTDAVKPADAPKK